MGLYGKQSEKSKAHEPHGEGHLSHEEQLRRDHLMLDPLPRGEMNAMVMESMHTTSWKFWVVFAVLSVIVAVGLFGAWGYMIAQGLGVAGVNRPSYWGIFLVNTVFWSGISHAGTFICCHPAGDEGGVPASLHAGGGADDDLRAGAGRV